MKPLLFIAIAFMYLQLNAQNRASTWVKTSAEAVSRLEKVRTTEYSEKQQLYFLNINGIKQALINANDKFSQKQGVYISFPNISGELEKYLVWENSNFEPQLQVQYPQIRAYIGKSTIDRTATIHFSVSKDGIQTMVLRANNESEFIESYTKDKSVYVLFDSKTRTKGALPLNCTTTETVLSQDNIAASLKTAKSNAGEYKTMRLALSCTGEYAQYFYGGTIPEGQEAVAKEKALAGMNATMTRVNGVYEKDLSVHLNIIANNDLVIYTNPASDPYSAAAAGANGLWNGELQITLTDVIGNDGYDIGHLFGRSGGGGSAGCFGCVCVDDFGGDPYDPTIETKGKGYTSPANKDVPEGDSFDIDYVAHEMGHQLGARHTYSYEYEGDGSSSVQVEPGSGSTIMGYAGVTKNYDVQKHSDAYFTYRSIKQIQNILANKTCLVSTTVVNTTPVVNAGPDYTIPAGTAYILKGSAKDADGDALTYCWEQNDPIKNGSPLSTNQNSEAYPEKIAGPNYRSFLPVNSPIRFMPELYNVVSELLSSEWESVSTVGRNLTFTLTARDNNVMGAQTNTDEMIVTSKAAYNAVSQPNGAGPFKVTSQNSNGVVWSQNSSQTVTWNVNNTNTLPGSTNVNIKLSVDGGITFPYTLASNVPNNGSKVITVPQVASSSYTCRIWIEPTNNIYFALNEIDFEVTTNLANEDFNLAGFSLYPNPNKGSFSIQFNSTSSNAIQIAVHDLRGRKVYNQEYTNTGLFSQNINLNQIQSGIYIVTVKDGDKKVDKKIVVE